jgi:putative hydrolase of the HAD superfamily
MPHLRECLGGLRAAGLLLGTVSNAQFYTRDLFEALLGEPVENCGFDPKLQYYSYQYGSAKPGLELFRLAAGALDDRGIAAAEALYVGNDMLNDILPAQSLGFRTALFAGDARSLRRHAGDPRLAKIAPDLVVTDLMSLSECMIS